MKKDKTNISLDFVIDKLTNSIENSTTGEIFNTSVVPFTSKEKSFNKKDWVFDWLKELSNQQNHVYKLVIREYRKVIHGLISFKNNNDHIFMNLIESAKFNKGKNKTYLGVAGNMIAYACKVAFENGYNGIIAFDAKSALIQHYKDYLNAKLFVGNRMFIDTPDSLKLVNKYFKTQ